MTLIEVTFTKPTKIPFALLSKAPKAVPPPPRKFECPLCHGQTKSRFPDITMCAKCGRLVDGGKVP